jgi:hypothetical protein
MAGSAINVPRNVSGSIFANARLAISTPFSSSP